MVDTVIWHNSRCSKSRQTLELLRANGIEPEIVDYQLTPPNISDIEDALQLLVAEPREIMRTGEIIYKELQLKNETDGRKLIDAMAANPILIERPIVFHGKKAAIGRPPENVLNIL